MNHLAHLALAGGDAPLVVGSFLGDFVKGRLQGQYPPAIERGLRLHRAIDSFTDQHPEVRAAARLLPPVYRRYAGIITDIAFDHYLARDWQDYHPQPLPDFAREALATLLDHRHLMPPAAAALATHMHQRQSLASYASPNFPPRALAAIAARLSRPSSLASAPQALAAASAPLHAAFRRFYPQLIAYARHWQADELTQTHVRRFEGRIG